MECMKHLSFDLDKYFRDEGLTDVKFGRREEIGDDDWESDGHILMYTQWEWEHRSPWWIQVKSQEERTLGSKVLEWIREQANEAKPKDVVSIILIGHSSPEGITFGGVNFSPSDLAGACSLFRTDVQVNVVVKTCHSGSFARAFRVANQRNIYVHTSAKVDEKSYSARRSISGRLRNSDFGQAFVRTLGLTRDIDNNWTLQKQKSYIEERLNRSDIPESSRSTPVVVSDSPITRLMKKFSSVIIWISPSLMPLSVLVEYFHQQMRLCIFCSNRNAISFHGRMARKSLLATRRRRRDDKLVHAGSATTPPREQTIVQLAHITWFRWKVQESFLCVAEELIRVGLISLDAMYMYTPMNLSQQTQSTAAVMRALNCFSIPRSCMDHRELIFGTHFFAPPLWLATLIVRSCTDWTRIVNRLTTVSLLGELDSELVLKVVQERPNFTVNPDEGKVTGDISKASSYGFWLPQGTRLGVFLSTWTERYSQVMEAYYIATGKHWEGFEDVEKRMLNLLTMEMELYN
ncbi:hypothetical protein POJ06DRAFT_285363 [Lipomyces tetrasporus]|uniref:Uncharacterized protein n=1 Tax=Lipomyces tetrasporus TaxID=54092 RepID=A0AAD7QZP8_9ASCO|nr:uncharacterized protein POJ06DRAFT_285363 [Lipomyces tetrasporus]KAJ8104399.1 hypothetical protein POJ06DRAFT_285363 [Lipomyces tetrasporus]